MTISVSVLSHAFFTERGVSRALSPAELAYSGHNQRPGSANGDRSVRKDQYPGIQADQSLVNVDREDADFGFSKLESPDSLEGQNVERLDAEKGHRPQAPAKESSSQQNNTKVERGHSRRKGNKRRGARRHNQTEKESRPPISEQGQDRTLISEAIAGIAEVLVRDIREECASALGIAKQDLELYGLCHIPRTAERARLLKDKSGVMHLGVLVKNSDLSLRTIEELVISKDVAEQDVEICQVQIREKIDDFQNLKLKYDKLIVEVLRLRTMLDRAHRLRRESENATEILTVEFEKLVKDMTMDCSEPFMQEATSEDAYDI